MKRELSYLHNFKLFIKVIRRFADNPYREALYQASLSHSNRWGTTSWS